MNKLQELLADESAPVEIIQTLLPDPDIPPYPDVVC
jgi:hypothetical protein